MYVYARLISANSLVITHCTEILSCQVNYDASHVITTNSIIVGIISQTDITHLITHTHK